MMDGIKPVVAFLGPRSSYSSQVALDVFDEKEWDFQGQVTIQDVFDAVQYGNATRGVVPFENSTNGSVVYTLDLFADRQKIYPDILVCGDAYLPIHHYLVGHINPGLATASPLTSGHATPTINIPHPVQPRTRPLTSLSHVRKIYSHPQAFGQCEVFLTTYLRGIERQDVSSTSKAAEMVAEDRTRSCAAISSKMAANIHDVHVLAEAIEDREDNTTRFFIITRRFEDDKTGLPAELPDPESKNSKSLVSFTVDHRSPGALADALNAFKTHQLNLTSINSRPSRSRPWHYIFFVEFLGSKTDDPNGAVSKALEALDKHAESWRWLGSWRDMRK